MTDLDLDDPVFAATIELAIQSLYRYDAEGQELESDESKAVRVLLAEVKRLRQAVM